MGFEKCGYFWGSGIYLAMSNGFIYVPTFTLMIPHTEYPNNLTEPQESPHTSQLLPFYVL